jgi:hypothetical protein
MRVYALAVKFSVKESMVMEEIARSLRHGEDGYIAAAMYTRRDGRQSGL